MMFPQFKDLNTASGRFEIFTGIQYRTFSHPNAKHESACYYLALCFHRGIMIFLAFVILFVLPQHVLAQQEGLMQIDDPLHLFLIRQQTAGRVPGAFLSHQPLSFYEAKKYLDTLNTQSHALTRVDRQRLAFFLGENPGPAATRLRTRSTEFYRNGLDLLGDSKKDWAVYINPMIYLTYGRARQTQRDNREASMSTWQRSYGLRGSGHLGKHVFFETRLTADNYKPVWLVQESGTAPRLGHQGVLDGDTYGYFTATGVVGINSKYIELRFGRDRNRWGYGAGSVVLSNYAPVYDQVQIRTTVGDLQYTNLFAALSEPRFKKSGLAIPRKYAAFHRLTANVSNRIQIGFFETIIFSSDSLGARSGFDLSYANPIIFYRSVERDRGSPDNVLLGGDVSWIVLPGLRVYGQFILDEIHPKKIGKEWWVNKWGWISGLHFVDFPISNLSTRFEFARLRPYLYSHQSPAADYIHYNDILGHPAGPNTRDFTLFLHYQPTSRIQASINLAYTQRGRNTATENYGADPREPYTTRISDTGITLLQGIRQNQLLIEGNLGYELLPSLYLEAAVRGESFDDDETGVDRYISAFLLIRWGLPFQSVRF